MRIPLIIIAIVFSSLARGQSYNDWITTMESENDTNKLLKESQRQLSLFAETGNEKHRINSDIVRSFIDYKQKKELERIDLLIRIIYDHPELRNDQTSWVHFHLASTLTSYHLHENAMEHANAVIDGAKKTGNKHLLCLGYQIKASIYNGMKDYSSALKYYKLTLNTADPSKIPQYASNLNNIALTYAKLNQPFLALDYYSKGLSHAKKGTDPLSLTLQHLISGNIGATYQSLEQYDLAKYFIQKEINFYHLHSPGDPNLAFSLMSLMEINNKTKEFSRNAALAKEMFRLAPFQSDPENELRIYDFLKDNDFFPYAGLDYKTLSEAQNSVLRKINLNQKNTQEAINYTIFRKKITDLKNRSAAAKEAYRSEQKNALFRTRSYLIIFFLLLAVLIAIILFLRQRAQQANNQLLIQEQKEFISKKQQIILEQENVLQKEHVNSLVTTLKIKQESESGFLEKLKELKRKKGVTVDQLINDLQLEINNLISIDKKLISTKLTNLDANHEFHQKLKSVHPDLSDTEIAFCHYFISGLSAKEIGLLHNMTDVSVRVMKNKIKNKLGLAAGTKLNDYIINLNNQ